MEVLASPFASLAPSSAAVPWVAARVSVLVVRASAFHSDSVYSLSVEELGASLFRWELAYSPWLHAERHRRALLLERGSGNTERPPPPPPRPDR